MHPDFAALRLRDPRPSHDRPRRGDRLLVRDIQSNCESRWVRGHLLADDIAHGAVKNSGDDTAVEQVRVGVHALPKCVEPTHFAGLSCLAVWWPVQRDQLPDCLICIPRLGHEGVAVAGLCESPGHAHQAECRV